VVSERSRESLAELVRSTPCVGATATPPALAEPLLDALGLRRFFAAVFGPSLEAEDETKSVTVGRALQSLPPGSRAAIVGDRRFDISAGRDHGIATIGALWGIGSEAELREAGADHLAEAPSHLAALLGFGSG
jgi:phosphoglycolate phosphatase